MSIYSVSIIMPCYNSSKFIKKAIASVLGQTNKNWELIIIDDCSFDNSLDIIKEYSYKEPRIKLLINEQNLGVADSRNKGMQEARFPLIAFIDSDDIWHEKKLELQISFMQKNNCAISFTQYFRIDGSGSQIGVVNNIPEIVDYFKLLKGNVIAMSTSIINISLTGRVYFKKIGHEDYFFWLEILKGGIKAKALKEKLVYYRVHSTSLSSNKLRVIGYTWFIYRRMLKLNLYKSIYFFLIHQTNAVVKRIRL